MLHRLFAVCRPTRRPAGRTFQPRVEALEDRSVPAFLAPVTTPGEFSAVGDFNNDGKADLVVVSQPDGPGTTATVGVRLRNGAGTGFKPIGPTRTVKWMGGSLQVADFNGDGKLDVMTTNTNSEKLVLLKSQGNGRFAAPTQIGLSDQYLTGFKVADLNGDGRADVVARGYAEGGHGTITSFYLNVLLAQANGKFVAGASIAVGRAVFGRGGRSQAPPASYYTGDFNGDGNPDVLTVARVGSNPYPTRILWGDGTGGLSAGDNVSGLASAAVTVADLDADGDADLVQNGTVFLGDGNGAFEQGQALTGIGAPVVADVNGDGRGDLISVNSAGGAVSVFLGNGDGTFQSARTFAAGPAPLGGVYAGDFNGDGRTDLALNAGGSQIAVLLNDGTW